MVQMEAGATHLLRLGVLCLAWPKTGSPGARMSSLLDGTTSTTTKPNPKAGVTGLNRLKAGAKEMEALEVTGETQGMVKREARPTQPGEGRPREEAGKMVAKTGENLPQLQVEDQAWLEVEEEVEEDGASHRDLVAQPKAGAVSLKKATMATPVEEEEDAWAHGVAPAL